MDIFKDKKALNTIQCRQTIPTICEEVFKKWFSSYGGST
tara:strand:- start:296 stop:412 length:117 start_codon:yes stop_codon:yes gene_type:complete